MIPRRNLSFHENYTTANRNIDLVSDTFVRIPFHIEAQSKIDAFQIQLSDAKEDESVKTKGT